MNRIEERYRRVLRVLPAAYLLEWEDDMVAAFLESNDTGDPDAAEFAADYGRPSVGEVASIVSLAVRLRLGGSGGSVRMQAVQLATLAMTLVHAVTAVTGIAVTLWLAGPVGSPAAARTALTVIGYAWLPAYLALVLGQRRAAQSVALLAIVPSVGIVAVSQATDGEPVTVTPWLLLLIDLLVVLAMSAFQPGDPPVRGRSWLLALPIGIVLVPGVQFALDAISRSTRLLDWPGLACIVLTGLLLGRRPGTLPWRLAVVLLAAVTLTVRLLTMFDYTNQVEWATLMTIGSIQAGVLVAVGIPAARSTIRAVRASPLSPGGR